MKSLRDFGGIVWIFASQQQRDQQLDLLKCLPCPHCKHVGALNRHGFLKGHDEQNFKQKTIRALRVFCSNRGKNRGCARTFSVWLAEKVKRLFIDAQSLWRFLEQAATSQNKSQAFAMLQCSLSDSAPYRIWKRFRQAQTAIRTALAAICPPPKQSDESKDPRQSAAQATIAHLKEAFEGSPLNPIEAYQTRTQGFFI